MLFSVLFRGFFVHGEDGHGEGEQGVVLVVPEGDVIEPGGELGGGVELGEDEEEEFVVGQGSGGWRWGESGWLVGEDFLEDEGEGGVGECVGGDGGVEHVESGVDVAGLGEVV